MALVLADLALTSTAFPHRGTIPSRYTCEGADVSPPLAWDEPPDATRSFALVVEDPDAPGKVWVHWLLWDLAASTRSLREDLPPNEPDVQQGRNDFGNRGYGGPCPPKGHGAHRYVFRLYALDTQLNLAPGSSRRELDAAMKGHVLATGELVGHYHRDR
ncbi:MAG: YbhB/YbcL family Raf kinase inhibitor-like protein [Myxococcota bacterium]